MSERLLHPTKQAWMSGALSVLTTLGLPDAALAFRAEKRSWVVLCPEQPLQLDNGIKHRLCVSVRRVLLLALEGVDGEELRSFSLNSLQKE